MWWLLLWQFVLCFGFWGALVGFLTYWGFFFARSCLGKVPGRAPFSQRSERATACTIRMQIVKQIIEETN